MPHTGRTRGSAGSPLPGLAAPGRSLGFAVLPCSGSDPSWGQLGPISSPAIMVTGQSSVMGMSFGGVSTITFVKHAPQLPFLLALLTLPPITCHRPMSYASHLFSPNDPPPAGGV